LIAIVKRTLGFCLLGASVVVLSQACGSSEGKKKVPGPHYTAGGEASGGASDTPKGGKSSGGTAGSTNDAGQPGNDAGSPTGVSGSAAQGGMESGVAGAGGAAGQSGDGCPTGQGECDDNPATVCEQNLNLITSCGDCLTTCQANNANVACEDLRCVVKSCTATYADCNTDGTDGCEASLKSDQHCGTCERDCAAVGSTCAATLFCNDIPLQTAQPIGSDSGVNRTWAFSPLGLLHVGFNSYVVRRFPLNGDPTLVIWDSTNKTAGVQSLLVQGTDVYWSELGVGADDFTSGVFYKAITDAPGVTKTLAWIPEWHVQYLRRQGNAFYWFSGDYQSGDPGAWIYTRKIAPDLNDHGTKIMSADQGTHGGVLAFNVTSDALYWVSNLAGTGTAYELRTAPIAGGAPTVVPAVPGGTGTAVTNYGGGPSLQVVGTTVYFNRDANDVLDGIYAFNKGDTTPTNLVQASDVRDFLVDDTSIYYHQQNVSGIFKAPLAGGAGVKISSGTASRLVGQDDKFVYAITSGCCNGSIFKVIK
jgi:hypothetical protein